MNPWRREIIPAWPKNYWPRDVGFFLVPTTYVLVEKIENHFSIYLFLWPCIHNWSPVLQLIILCIQLCIFKAFLGEGHRYGAYNITSSFHSAFSLLSTFMSSWCKWSLWLCVIISYMKFNFFRMSFFNVICSLYIPYTMYISASTSENLPFRVCEQHRRRPACASAQSD